MYNYKELLDWKYKDRAFTMLDPFDYSTLEWNDSSEKPSKELLETKIDLIKASNLLVIQQKRESEYPPMQDYVDGIVKGDQEQIQKYIDDCLAVKAKYPKPL